MMVGAFDFTGLHRGFTGRSKKVWWRNDLASLSGTSPDFTATVNGEAAEKPNEINASPFTGLHHYYVGAAAAVKRRPLVVRSRGENQKSPAVELITPGISAAAIPHADFPGCRR